MLKLSLIILTVVILFFGGCLNKRGVSSTYYNDCREYYDVQGTYHKDCKENLIEFKDLQEEFDNILNPKEQPRIKPNVY